MSDQAREALRLAEADPRRAVEFATALAQRASAERDLVTQSIAERALGNAALWLEDLDTALRHLRTALRLGTRADSPELAAEARLRLAFALNIRGRSRQAIREIDVALRDARGTTWARAEAQRGAILHQLGRLDDALASYRAAIPALRRAGDHLWLHRVLSNRGVLYGYRHEYTAAEADLREAERLCRMLDLSLSLGFVQQNLGWVNTVRGDVPAALHYLHLAEQRFRELRSHLGEIFADRSQLLLSVSLVSEARDTAEQAVRLLERERRQIGLPEVRLLLARAATLDGDHARSLREAQCAVREFTRQQRPEWAALARFVMLTSRLAGAERSNVAVQQLERAAAALTETGWPADALEARLRAGQLALERGWTRRGCQQLQHASRERHRGPVVRRARAWHAEALLRLSSGNRRGATIAIRTALRILDEHRATLGATDLRAYASGHRAEVAELGLRMAFEDGRPGRVLEWAEEGRASHLLMRPARPPDDPRLADALTELRATVGEIDERRVAGLDTTRLVRRQIALEREIRDHCRRQPGDSAFQAIDRVPVGDLAAGLGDTALVEFIQIDQRVHAVTLVDGRCRLHRLGPMADMRDLVDRVAFAMHRLARDRTGPESRAAAIALLRHSAGRLDDVLFRPIAAVLADRSLVVIPTGPLQSLPWSILPSCAGRPVTVSPSAALWHIGLRPAKTDGHVVIAAGPGLPGARAEATAVAAIHHTTALVDGTVTVKAVTNALDGANLAHLAAHGRIHPTNPLFSSLRLADGPLTVYDLEQLRQVPQMVVLAACDAGRPVVLAGDELLGLSATLLAQGAQQIVASVVPIPDAETAPLMVAFHRLLIAGYSAAAALARAQQQMADDTSATVAAAAGFICMGADYKLISS